jgi:hypothetical protein
VSRHRQLLIFRDSTVHLNTCRLLQTFTRPLNLEALIFDLKLVKRFDCLLDSSFV